MISIQISRAGDIADSLRRISSPAAARSIGVMASSGVKRNFVTQGREIGSPWQPIRGRIKQGIGVSGGGYVRRSATFVPGGVPLRDTGALMNSIRYAVTGHDIIVSASKMKISRGGTVNIAAIHHFGGKVRISRAARVLFAMAGIPISEGKTHFNIPARPFMKLSASTVRAIVDFAGGQIVGR